jgi:hypothetical protein
MSRLISLFPREFRARYGEEILELLESSDHPTRDRIDIVQSAGRLRMEDILKNRISPMIVTAVAIGAASLTAFVLAVPELAGGLRDVPQHWWSSIPVLGMASASTLAILDLKRADR